jgi:tetratricopeptide (TPR) repeat protein
VVAFGIVSVLSLWLQRRAPALLAAWLTFLVLLLPNLGLLQAGGQAVADRFMYVAMVPVLLVIAAACVWFWRRAPAVGRIGLVGLLGCELVLLAWRTRGQLPVWHDDVTLWQAVVRQFPDSTTEYRFVAQGLIEQRRFEEALPYAREAAARLPADQLARSELALVYRELAGTRAEQGRFEEAFAFASDAVRLNPDDPSARSLFGYVLLKTGHSADAAQQCREALRLDASLPAARYNLACAYAQLGRLAEARTALDQAVALNPRLAAVAARDPELAALHN